MAVESLITQHIDTWTSAVKTKSTTGRGSRKKLDLYGIKKLRELILELAVRGKLVPQDPNDEPASVLLERIVAEKAQLIKEKKIKKQKELPAFCEEDILYRIPSNWSWCRLDDVCFGITSGSTPPKSNFNETTGVPYLKVYNIQEQKIDFEYKPQFVDCEYHLTKLQRSILYPGDVVMNIVGPPLGKVAIIPDDYPEWNCNQAITFFRPIESCLNQYIYMYLRAGLFLKEIELIGTAGQDNISVTKSRSILLPLPPLKEQHRIVDKVDELMTLCDQLEQQTEASIEAHQLLVSTLLNTLTHSADADELMENWARISDHFDTLFTTEESIDQLKQTILQLAVMGKLIPQDPNDEPASVLLEHIAEEKAQLIKEKKIKKQKALPPIADDEKPFELPKGWEWIRLGALTSLVTSGSRGWNKYYSDSGATFIRSQDIKYDRVEFDNRAFVELPQSTEGKRTKVDLGDILVTITGANVGKAAVVEQELPEAYVSQHVSLIKLMDQRLSPYIHLWLTGSHGGRLHLLSQSYGDKPGLNLQNINELVVPVAPEEHQLLVLTKVDQLMELCERLKQRLCDSQQTQLKLTDAIVEQAL
ncbi:restriction endonuclease subunit S [Photobacterium phosphoreum]|uniref:restriction endonuclease subunit S n=1 Tax=Photobacterium phosphoreum TaxID=659 RepID=UPI001E41BF0A|nr:restriction endonuclease subunit S [Photobacterium phosphoreum]MCD9502819.1 restriction endonuclease subunit S [Photobacterium phosphoreum]